MNILNDFISVHDLPLQNARVAIVTKTSEVFREHNDLSIARTPAGTEYVAWGNEDDMPYKIIDLIEADETLSTCQVFNAEVCYGSGLHYCTKDAAKPVAREVEN